MQTKGGFSLYIQKEVMGDLIGSVQYNKQQYQCKWNSQGILMDMKPSTPALEIGTEPFRIINPHKLIRWAKET